MHTVNLKSRDCVAGLLIIRINGVDLIGERDGAIPTGIIIDVHFEMNRRGFGGYLRRGDVGAPLRYVDWRGLGEPYIPVDSSAGIPTRGERRIIEPDGE